MLDHIPCELHIIVKICKCNLGLDHPKLSRMTCCVRIFSTKGGTEGIYITKRHSIGFALKLTRNGKVSALAKEIL